MDNQLQSDINKAREVVYKLTPEGRQGKITLDSPITLFDKDFRQGAVNNLVAAGKRYLKDICELTDAQFEIIGLNRTEINNVRVILYELTPEGRQGKISLKAPIAMFFDRFGQGSVNRFIESGYTHLSDLQGLGYDDIHKITKNNLTTKYIIELINSNTIDSPL